MPLSNRTTPANGSETDQVIPFIGSVEVKTNKRGRPRKPLKVLAVDKAYNSKNKRAVLIWDGIWPQWPKGVWKTKKNKDKPIKISLPRCWQERCFPWYQKKYRRLVVRWEGISACFDGFLSLAIIHIWINKIMGTWKNWASSSRDESIGRSEAGVESPWKKEKSGKLNRDTRS